ncbi:MAG: bifunctional folylpolyglutamate synthase/dihydrofolate synthase [Tannerellaceae bacterium]|nr:bifunctional folylpolyglutamate synthase/dihydrofolate synthase [Tannerellaceae bacterium]
MSYQETLQYLYTATPVFEKTGSSAYKPGLQTMDALSEHTGHPHTAYSTIHVAGTNGKGSVCHLLAAILAAAGYRVGLYTSPHLLDFRERIQVNGELIPENYVTGFVNRHKDFFEPLHPSFFEVTTALAFDWFREDAVDVAVIETGLGGRLDSTNIISPILSIITSISRDHTDLLGEDLQSIALEKAGIIKPEVPLVLGYDIRKNHDRLYHIFQQQADACHAPLYSAWSSLPVRRFCTYFHTGTRPVGTKYITSTYSRFNSRQYGHIVTSLVGKAGHANTVTVLTALSVLVSQGFSFSAEHVAQAFAHPGLNGRWQQLRHRPLVICDGGHNADAWKHICRQIDAYHKAAPFRKLHFLLGFSADKDLKAIIPCLPLHYPNAVFYCTQASSPRALEAHTLLDKINAYATVTGKAFPSLAHALDEACAAAQADDFLFIGGSFFVVGEVLPLFSARFGKS